MDLLTFVASIDGTAPPGGLSHALQALWYEKRGDWQAAHGYAQQQDDRNGAWVHAYLHRKEGDLSNAGYWYRRAGRPTAQGSLEEEWEAIARTLLQEFEENKGQTTKNKTD